MNLLPEFRKASILTGGSVVFGTANCTATVTVFAPTRPPCSSIKADRTLADFVKKIVKPSVISLSFDEFYDRVGDKDEDEMWLIDTTRLGADLACNAVRFRELYSVLIRTQRFARIEAGPH